MFTAGKVDDTIIVEAKIVPKLTFYWNRQHFIFISLQKAVEFQSLNSG